MRDEKRLDLLDFESGFKDLPEPVEPVESVEPVEPETLNPKP
jgi:hypothetical protein